MKEQSSPVLPHLLVTVRITLHMYCLYICPFIFFFFLYQHSVFLISIRTPSTVMAEARQPHSCCCSWHTACIPLHPLPSLPHCALLHSHHSCTLFPFTPRHWAPFSLATLSFCPPSLLGTRQPAVCVPLSGLLLCIYCQLFPCIIPAASSPVTLQFSQCFMQTHCKKVINTLC